MSPYFQKLDKGIQNTYDVVMSMVEIVKEVFVSLKRLEAGVDVVADKMDDVSDKTTIIHTMIGDLYDLLAKMVPLIREFQESADTLQKAGPYVNRLADTFRMVGRLWYTFWSMLDSFLNLFRDMEHGPLIAFILLLGSLIVWLFFLRGIFAKMLPVAVLYIYDQFPVEIFRRTSLYVLGFWSIVMVPMLVVFYCFLRDLYLFRQLASEKILRERYRLALEGEER